MKRKILIRVFKLAKPFKNYFFLIYSFMIIEILVEQILPRILGDLINSVVYEYNLKLFFLNFLKYLVLFSLGLLSVYCLLLIWQKLNNAFIFGIRQKCFERILLSEEIQNVVKNTGDLAKIIMDDTEEFINIIQRYAMRLINNLISIAIAIFVMIKISVELTVIILVISSFLTIIVKNHEKKLLDVSTLYRKIVGENAAWELEVVKNFKELSNFTSSKSFLTLFSRKLIKLLRQKIHCDEYIVKSKVIIEFCKVFTDFIIFTLGIFYVSKGVLNIGDYVALIGYTKIINQNFKAIIEKNVEVNSRFYSLQRVIEILDLPSEKNEGVEMVIDNPNISIVNLKFSYGKHLIFENANCEFFGQKIIGVTGKNGVGKTTLFNLLLGYEKGRYEGKIFIDKKDIMTYSIKSIRKNINMFNQNTILINGTLRENIEFGNRLQDKDIWEIIQKVHLVTFINSLPDGMDTIIHYDDKLLSGGERIKIALARILCRDAKIVLFDEPFSSLDVYSEELVIQLIKELSYNRIIIIISHREKILEICDSCIEIKDRKIEMKSIKSKNKR